jgi:TetR/AcrR family transcriptional regulator, mexJK operon transcriptional repressor
MSSEQLQPNENAKAGRPRASEAEARLQDLMNTAANLFREKGYSKVSLELIAREAHVAVRTIYVKFGGKAGLFKALVLRKREEFFATMESLEESKRPIREVLLDYGLRFHQLVTSPEVVIFHQIVIAEAHNNSDLAGAFFDAGPRQTREMLSRFFSRDDIRAQLRDDLDPDRLAIYLLNCLMGDQLKRFLFDSRCAVADGSPEEIEQGIDLFLRGVLR